jgi:ABC-type sugar transport system substrate-binding protein
MKNRESDGRDDGVLASEFSRRAFLAKAGAAGLVVASGGALANALSAAPASAATKVPLAIKRPSSSVVGSLPKAVQQYYELATTTPLGPSLFRNWKPKRKPPWKIGFASSFAGNSWRIGTLTRLDNYLIPVYKKAGLISEVITLQSNLSIPVQIQQIRQLVSEGCDAIFTIAAPPTSLNDAIKYAYENGVLFVVQQGGVTSPYAQQISGNYALCGKLQATSLGKSMGGKGNVLIVQGIPQAEASADFQRGHEIGLKAYPGIKVTGVVAGTWVDSVAKTAPGASRRDRDAVAWRPRCVAGSPGNRSQGGTYDHRRRDGAARLLERPPKLDRVYVPGLASRRRDARVLGSHDADLAGSGAKNRQRHDRGGRGLL